jgi:hypothetical protein
MPMIKSMVTREDIQATRNLIIERLQYKLKLTKEWKAQNLKNIEYNIKYLKEKLAEADVCRKSLEVAKIMLRDSQMQDKSALELGVKELLYNLIDAESRVESAQESILDDSSRHLLGQRSDNVHLLKQIAKYDRDIVEYEEALKALESK